MPFAVTSQTGFPFRRGAHVFHPTDPIVLDGDELTDEIKAEVNNLRFVEVDEDGTPILPEKPANSQDEAVSSKDYEAAVKRAEEAESEAERLKSEATAKDASHSAQVAVLESLLPTGKTALNLLKVEQLKDLAEYRGKTLPEGADKAAYVEELTKGAE